MQQENENSQQQGREQTGATDDARVVGAATGGGTTTTGSDFGTDVTGALERGTGDLGEATGASDRTNVGLDSGADITDSSARDAPAEDIPGSSNQ